MKTEQNCFYKSTLITLMTIFFIASSMIMNKAGATNYYVSATGSDASNGLTTLTTWLTIGKVNHSTFSPGDSILFRRGDAWREGESLYAYYGDGTPGRPIVYGAYGVGAKPLILASKDISSSSFWTVSSGNIWKTTSKINLTTRDFPGFFWQTTPDVANLIFNSEASIGVKKRYITDLTTQGYFCLNLTDTLLYLYSTVNPSAFYLKIEAAGIRNCEDNIVARNKKYFTFLNLDIRYSKNNGINLRDCSNILIDRCDFSWIGGTYYNPGTSANPGRMGNGVQMWQGNSDIIVKNCTFNQVYDAGISPQGQDVIYSIHNINMHHNLIRNCHYSFEFWGHQAGSTGDSIFFENNTCLNAGSGWSAAQRPDIGRAAHLQFSTSKMLFSNVFIRNNIFAESVNFCSDGKEEQSGSAGSDAVWAGITMDYNCYFQSGGKQVIRWRGGTSKGGGDYNLTNLADYQLKSGKEAHSIFADPKLNGNYTLQTGSPAIDAGRYVGFPYSGTAPEIGAFESSTVTAVPENIKLNSMKIYPNPMKTECCLVWENANAESYMLNIYDIRGKLIKNVRNIRTSEYTLKRNNLSKGIYIIELNGKDQRRGKLLVE